jgi:hypothetical protein
MSLTKAAKGIASLFTMIAATTLAACLQHGGPRAVAVRGPEANCADACERRAPDCRDTECARGCRVALDRLVEREQREVVACVARESRESKTCDDMTFALCAARSGPYADGGPAPPKPPSDDDDSP